MAKRKSKIGLENEAKRVKIEETVEEEFYNRVLRAVNSLEGPGYMVNQMFKQLPPKKQYPDYYDLIPNPVSLKEIQQKVSRQQYENDDEFVADFALMRSNAEAYNDKESEIAKDAGTIYEKVKEMVDQKRSVEETKTRMVDVLQSLIDYETKDDGRQLSEWFMVEPSKEDYPDYYKVIERPMSFSTIQSMIERDELTAFDELVELVQLIFNNAKQYNDSQSQVYVDSEELEGVFQSKIGKKKSEPAVKLKISKKEEEVVNEESGNNEPTQGDEEISEEGQNGQENGENEEEEEEQEEDEKDYRKDVIDDARFRPEGKGLDDALMTTVSLTSVLPNMSRYHQQKNHVSPTYNDMFRINIPASKQLIKQSRVIQLPQYHSNLHLELELHESLNNRHFTIVLAHNQRKLVPISSTSTNPWAEGKPQRVRFELRLQTGLNEVELLCQAAPPNPRQRAASTTPQVLSNESLESETVNIYIMVGRM